MNWTLYLFLPVLIIALKGVYVYGVSPHHWYFRDNPCDPLPNFVPNFTAPGRTFIQIKCFEALWELKRQEQKAFREMSCELQHVSGDTPAVIGGKITFEGEYPHMAAIGWKSIDKGWIIKCGGTLVSSKFVLSAAHCTKVSTLDSTIADPAPKIVRLGDKNIMDTRHTSYLRATHADILRSIVHPQYNPPKKYYDIALFELKEDVQFDSLVVPACLWPHEDTSPLGTEAAVTGWGVVDTGRRNTSPTLLSGSVSIIPSDVCDKQLRRHCSRKFCGIKDHQICAANITGRVDACQGDSGGPLQVKIHLPSQIRGSMHYVIGVTSFGIGCARQDKPGVYTRVSYFIDWIQSIVWPNATDVHNIQRS